MAENKVRRDGTRTAAVEVEKEKAYLTVCVHALLVAVARLLYLLIAS